MLGINFVLPCHDFDCSTAVAHATTNQKNVNVFFFDGRLGQSETLGYILNGNLRHFCLLN